MRAFDSVEHDGQYSDRRAEDEPDGGGDDPRSPPYGDSLRLIVCDVLFDVLGRHSVFGGVGHCVQCAGDFGSVSLRFSFGGTLRGRLTLAVMSGCERTRSMAWHGHGRYSTYVCGVGMNILCGDHWRAERKVNPSPPRVRGSFRSPLFLWTVYCTATCICGTRAPSQSLSLGHWCTCMYARSSVTSSTLGSRAYCSRPREEGRGDLRRWVADVWNVVTRCIFRNMYVRCE
jgi:hypothetical protein